MTAPAVAPRRVSSPFIPIGPGVLINRAAEAERLARFVTQATSRFVVLYGKPASGKTTLVKHWLVPALQAIPTVGRDNVYYAACTTEVPAIVEGQSGHARFDDVIPSPAIVIIDEFDHVLDAPRDDRRRQLDPLFARLRREDCRATVVAVVSERQLTSVYALTSYEPGIVNAVDAIGTVSLSEGLQRLCSQQKGQRSLSYSVAALAAIEAEAKDRHLDATFDFVKLIHARFSTLLAPNEAREFGADDYMAVGRLDGILREQLDRTVEAIDTAHAGSAVIATAILVRVLEAQTRAAAVDLNDIGPRLGVHQDDVQRVLRELVDRDLLLPAPNGQYQFQPPQVGAIIEADRAAHQADNDRARRIVAEGLRSWQLLGTFLPPARFAEIHRQRRAVSLDDESTRFLLQCALRQEDDASSDAAKYWLARMTSADDGMDVLLAALFDSAPSVRTRAARLLASFDDPLVRDRLCVLALSDAAAECRTAAIDSLTGVTNDELLATIRREIDNPRSPNRANAVEALRLFPRPEVTALLRALVNDSTTLLEVREKAISVLAVLNTTDSIEALVAIGLDDPDRDDRAAAAQALTRVQTEELNRHVLQLLDWRRPVVRIAGRIVLLSVLLFVSAMIVLVVIGLASGWLDTNATVGAALAGLLVLTVCTGTLLVGIEEGRIKRRSPAGILGAILFIVCSVTYALLLHGLSHLMVRRTRRALTLFGLELAGVAFYVAVAAAAESITGLEFLATIYRAIGALLFLGSYLYDVFRIALDLFVMRRAMTRNARCVAIYQEIFGNAVMTSAVIADLESADAKAARRARRLVRRFGERMAASTLVDRLPEARGSRRFVVSALSRAKDDQTVARLAGMWTTATAATKRAIAKSLARSPTAAAVQTLGRLSAGGNTWLKLRAWLAKVQFSLDVWPRPAQAAALVLLPVVGMLLYHGGMMAKNHAWGEIILLRQPVSSPERKARIVDFLADVYPRESTDELRRMFASGQHERVDQVHAAVTRGLVKIIDANDEVYTDSLRRDLTSETVRFDSLLRSTDPADFAMAISVLGDMARSSDSALAVTAVRLITNAADTTAKMSAGSERLEGAVQALSRARYDRALPALFAVLNTLNKKKAPSKQDAELAHTIQNQMDRVATQAYDSLKAGDGEGRERLRQTLLKSLPARTDLIAELQRQQLASQCASTGDDRCGADADALRAIEKSPESESGYRDLYRHYAADSQYQAAARAFEKLVVRYPKNVWPRKILAEIYHENLPTEPRSFSRAYDEMIALRDLAAYQALKTRRDPDYARIEADFAEVAMSAGHSRELEAAANDVVVQQADLTQHLNMALFLYFAAVVDRDSSANARLSRLESIVDSLPRDFNNEWVYPGTRAFIQRSNVPDHLKSALLQLCREGKWYAADKAKDVIAANRRELAAAPVARSGRRN
jgi:HEAT repeats